MVRMKATAEDIKRWRSLRDQGMTYEQVANECGVNTSLVYKWLNPGYRSPVSEKRLHWQDEERQMIALYRGGVPVAGIAKQLGCSHTRVGYVLERAGLRQRRRRNTLTEEQNEQIEELLDAGLTYEAVALQVGCSTPTVANRMRRRGVPAMPRIDPRTLAEMRPDMVEMRRSGMTFVAIGKKLGIGKTTVRRHLADMGIL